jgi:hypothetical protein
MTYPNAMNDAPPPLPAQGRAGEPIELRYARQTRNAVVTLAVIAVLGIVGSLIAGIVVAVSVVHLNNAVNNGGGSSSSNCMSQGGTDPSC